MRIHTFLLSLTFIIQISAASDNDNQFLASSKDDSAPVTFKKLATSLKSFASCTPIQRVRREIRDLTSEQRTAFLSAFLKLHKNGNFDDLVIMHGDRMTGKTSPIHFTEQFFPWHRLYMRDIEDRLIALGTLWPDFGIPYWDNSIDSQYPHDSIVFTADYVGKVNQNKDGIIMDSALAGFQFTIPNKHFITRGYEGNISQFVHSSVVEYQYKARDQSFSEFSQNFENFPHAIVHSSIDGDFKTWNSPNDPLFFLHHSYMDKSWSDWQNKGNNFKKFDGEAFDSPLVLPTDAIHDFGHPISYTFNITNLCYSYREPGDIAIQNSVDLGINVIKPPVTLPESWFNTTVFGMKPNRTAVDIQVAKTQRSTSIINKLRNNAVKEVSSFILTISIAILIL